MVSATERLMDGLLAEEHVCFTGIASGVRLLAVDLARALANEAKRSGPTQLFVRSRQLLPDPETVEAAVMPPIGDLLAMTRERTLVVVRRQMKACQSAVSTSWDGLGAAGVATAKSQAMSLERSWYERARVGLQSASVAAFGEMTRQAEIWFARQEPVDALIARWTLETEIRNLSGAKTRGALWQIRVAMNAEARNASVAVTNGLLLAGMAGWNAAAASA